jgi:hypothetical protein
MSSQQQPTLAPVHVYAIEALVQETKRPLEEVAQLYVTELNRLGSGARLRDYLVVLTSKRVRESLRRRKPAGFVAPSAFNPLPDRDLP